MNSLDHQRQEGTIVELLEQSKTIAVVGMDRRPEVPANYVPAYLTRHGYRIIPVNPYAQEVNGLKSYPNLAAIPDPVDLVLLFRRSEHVLPFVQQALEIGAKAVWMQSGIENDEAAALAKQAGLAVVMDACMMIEHRQFLRSPRY